MAKRIPHAAKVDAVRRVRLGGEDAKLVASQVGVDRRQIYRWEKDPDVARDAGLDALPKLPPPPVDTPLLSDVDARRLLSAVREGMAPTRAMRLVGRRPGTWTTWTERAAAGDEECARIVDMVTRADAEAELACVQSIRKGGMGWQGPAWLLERRHPDTYSADAVAEAAAGLEWATEDLVAVVRAAGLVE